MQLLERVVVEALVAEVEHEIGPEIGEIPVEGRVVVEVAELVGGQLEKRILQAPDRLHVLGIERAAALHRIGQPRVAHQHGHVDLLQLAARLAGRKLGRIRRKQQAARHHAEILVAVGQRLGVAVVADVAEAALLEQLGDAVARVEALGVELVGDDAELVVDDHLARDEPLAVGRERALAADEMMLVDPLPRAPLEVVGHIGAVGDVEHELTRRAQELADGRQHLLVVLLVREVAERIAHDGDAVEAALGEPRVPRVAFLEDDGEPLASGRASWRGG